MVPSSKGLLPRGCDGAELPWVGMLLWARRARRARIALLVWGGEVQGMELCPLFSAGIAASHGTAAYGRMRVSALPLSIPSGCPSSLRALRAVVGRQLHGEAVPPGEPGRWVCGCSCSRWPCQTPPWGHSAVLHVCSRGLLCLQSCRRPRHRSHSPPWDPLNAESCACGGGTWAAGHSSDRSGPAWGGLLVLGV